MIEVTWIETGLTMLMGEQVFFEQFGEAEGLEVLAGHVPHIVAVEVDA